MKMLLNKGYIKSVETWGSDRSIIEAARMSTDKGFLGWGNKDKPGDEKLLAYLMNNNHNTPFEMAGMIVEVQAPIFVFREWHRHRTQSYNELSARYTELPDFNFVPTLERLLRNVDGTNKQANRADGAPPLSEGHALLWLDQMKQSYDLAQEVYKKGLAWGVPKEVARIVLPVGRYSRMRASANLRNWLAFVTLRSDPHAQEEIRVYSNAVLELIAHHWPRTYVLFMENRV